MSTLHCLWSRQRGKRDSSWGWSEDHWSEQRSRGLRDQNVGFQGMQLYEGLVCEGKGNQTSHLTFRSCGSWGGTWDTSRLVTAKSQRPQGTKELSSGLWSRNATSKYNIESQESNAATLAQYPHFYQPPITPISMWTHIRYKFAEARISWLPKALILASNQGM